jgi:hypothetical protein
LTRMHGWRVFSEEAEVLEQYREFDKGCTGTVAYVRRVYVLGNVRRLGDAG